MPTLNPGTPPLIAVDDQIYIKALEYYGQRWLKPSAIAFQSYTFDTSGLVAGGRVDDPGINPADLISSLIPGNFLNPEFLTPKMRQLVQRYLYDQYVSATGVEPPPDPIPPVTPPDDYFPPVAPVLPAQSMAEMIQEIHGWLDWFRREMPTRSYIVGSTIHAVGTGQDEFPLYTPEGPSYQVAPCGFQLRMTVVPDIYSRTMAGDPPIYWDLGNFAWGEDDVAVGPIKVMHHDQLVYPAWPRAFYVRWNLKPGVEMDIVALYPTQVHISTVE